MKIVEKPFSLDDLDTDLKKLNSNGLVPLLNLEKIGQALADTVKGVKDTIKLH